MTDLMDGLALFTHGQFLSEANDRPDLLLMTHGEFPRPLLVIAVVTQPEILVVGRSGDYDYDCKRKKQLTREEIVILLLLLDDD